MPKRKRQPEEFDVAEFLRESDDDLKSALNSLLRTAEPGPEVEPALNFIPESPIELSTPANLVPDPFSGAAANLDPPATFTPKHIEAGGNLVSGLNLVPGPRKRRFAIREMTRTQDAHTRAEQYVYECLWEAASSYDEVSRAITIGFGAMARLVGLSESNARINLRSLIAKLAIEEIGAYNCERSVGRTYRILHEAEILRRRREAGLRWFMRRTLAVVFVDPVTGQPLLKGKPLRRQDPVVS